MNIIEWRTNPETAKKAADILATPVVQEMLSVLRVTAVNETSPPNASDAALHIAHGCILGYSQCLKDFVSLGVLAEPSASEETDYKTSPVPKE